MSTTRTPTLTKDHRVVDVRRLLDADDQDDGSASEMKDRGQVTRVPWQQRGLVFVGEGAQDGRGDDAPGRWEGRGADDAGEL